MNRPEVQNKGYSKYTAQKLPVNARHTNSQRGIAKVIRANKRAEAEARQAVVADARTRKHRRFCTDGTCPSMDRRASGYRGRLSGLSAADILALTRRM